MYCQKCGATLENGARFCVACGSEVTAPQQTTGLNTQQQPYTQSSYSNTSHTQQNLYPSPYAPLRVGEYIVMFILTAIPVVNLVMLLVWTFGSYTNINKKNYAKAALILALIGVGIWLIIGLIVAAFGFSLFRSGGYYNYY